jgi:hypothetical protein
MTRSHKQPQGDRVSHGIERYLSQHVSDIVVLHIKQRKMAEGREIGILSDIGEWLI